MNFNTAKSYVTEKLGVVYVEDKSVLLNNVIRAYYEKVPFQNITVSLLELEELFPSEQSVIEYGTTLKGGVSIHKNWFIKILLEALGYDVHFIAGSILQPPATPKRPNGSHIAVVVKNLTKKGDLHLVETGCGFPVFKPVNLNELPFTATDVTLTYRFVEENGQWHKEHKAESSDEYTRFMTYEKKPQPSIEFFRTPMLEMLNEDWLVRGITAVRYLQPNSPDIPGVPDFKPENDYLELFKDNTITFKNTAGYEYNEKVPNNLIVDTFKEYFPTIPSDEVAKKVQIVGVSSSSRPWNQCTMI